MDWGLGTGDRGPRSNAQHTVHAAATGTSLIGCVDWKMKTGQVTSVTAARMAAGPPDIPNAIDAVATTAIAADSATTTLAANGPPSASGSAISSGSPGP